MADVALGILGLIPPFIQFTVRIGNSVKKILDTKNFADDPSSLHCIRREIKSLKNLIETITSLQEQTENRKYALLRSCKYHLRKYRSMLKKVKDKMEEYNEHKEMYLIIELQRLLKALEEQQHKEEVQKWLTAVNTKILTETLLKSLHGERVKQQKSSNNIEASLEASLPLLLNRISELNARLETTSESLSREPETPDIHPLRLQDWAKQFVESPGDFNDSLLGEYGSSDESDNSDFEPTSPDEKELDTADTSLQDLFLTQSAEDYCGSFSQDPVYSDQCTMTDTVYSERGTMPCVVGMDPPSRSVPDATLCVRKLIASVATRDYEDTRKDGFPQLVAGSWEQTSPAGVEIMEITEEDWYNNQHFDASDSESVTIRIALPEARLRELIKTYGEELESLPETKSTTRRFSAILLPSTPLWPYSPGTRDSFCHTLDKHYHETRLVIRWDMEYMSTKGAVYFRLGKLKELFENIETKGPKDSTCPLPSLRGIAVCITIPWANYCHWAQGQATDDALDTLWEQGIVATLPVLVRLQNGTVDPHMWCPEVAGLSKSSGTRWREVHAIIQEYVHPGLPPETGYSSSETRFIVVIYKTGGPSDWVEVVQSMLCQNPGQMLKPYRLSPNGMCMDVDDLIKHYQRETEIAKV